MRQGDGFVVSERLQRNVSTPCTFAGNRVPAIRSADLGLGWSLRGRLGQATRDSQVDTD
jgi:hypothetical protein